MHAEAQSAQRMSCLPHGDPIPDPRVSMRMEEHPSSGSASPVPPTDMRKSPKKVIVLIGERPRVTPLLESNRPNDGGEIAKGAIPEVEAFVIGKVQGGIGEHVEGIHLSEPLNCASRPPTAHKAGRIVHEHDMRLHIIHLCVVVINKRE